MIRQEPTVEKRHQSPNRNTSGNSSKYVARNRRPSSSPQKPTGMDGIGEVMTSSPSSPTTTFPSRSNALASTPRLAPDISPTQTGCSGDAWTSPVQTSVPPLPTLSRTDGPSCSATQRNPSAGNGLPATPS